MIKNEILDLGSGVAVLSKAAHTHPQNSDC